MKDGTCMIPVQNTLRSVYFIDGANEWAVGEGGVILATTDGGETWTQQTSTITTALNSIIFTSPSTGWAVGGSELYTSDGGLHWNTQRGCTISIAYGVHFAFTTDVGLNWSPSLTGSIPTLLAVSMVNQGTGWASGNPDPVQIHHRHI